MNNSKLIVAMLLIATLVAPFVLNTQPAVAGDADDSSWYNTVDGVLSTDDYYLYPYLAQDLKLGYSKFGEKIDATTWTGLQYNGPVTDSAATSGADPFANPGIDPNRYVEGWWLGITYQHRTQGWRTLWAWAEFADFTAWGSPTAGDYVTPTYSPGARVTSDGWIRMPYATDAQDAASGSPHGGRKTNARCVTEDIKVLYDGPRRYIALVSTTLYDQSVIVPSGDDAGDPISESGSNVAVVRLDILIEFNKVKKEIIQKKDVKLLIDDKTMLGDYAYLEFSNRGEWDLGTTGNYRSYAHFYTVKAGADDAPSTVYNEDYHKDRSEGVYGMQYPGLTADTGTIDDYYAKAQIISDGAPYVGWAAYWPHPSYWTVYGWGYEWDPIGQDFSPNDVWDAQFGEGMFDPADTDYNKPQLREDDIADAASAPRPATFRITATEPEIPFVIGEWNFIFSLSRLITQFRGVTVYGVTDVNDATDNDQAGTPGNTIDSEVAYQNNEIFNPFDLNKAVHKQTSRQIVYLDNTDFSGDDTTITPYHPQGAEDVYIPNTEAINDNGWRSYCTSAERVLVKRTGGDFELAARTGVAAAGQDKYTWAPSTDTIVLTDLMLYVDGAYLGINDAEAPTVTVKVLYTVWPIHQKVDEFAFGATTTVVTLVYGPITATGDVEAVVNLDDLVASTRTLALSADGMTVTITNLAGDAEGENGKIIYLTRRGTYEWGVAGTGAASIDSVGLGMITQAFDSKKNIEVVKTGLDIQDTVSGTAVPYTFSGTGNQWSGYKDDIGRVSLQNDYCTSNAIKSSNIIILGGPDGANLGSYYMNDFGPLFYGNEYAHSDYRGKILKHECWDRHNTAHNDNELYGPGDAVIQVYKDIDGTVILAIWGKTGQETYYAAMWFWGQGRGLYPYSGVIQTWWDVNNDGIVDSGEKTNTPGIVFLQDMNPGVTAIDLHFGDKYNDADDTGTTTTFEGFVTVTEALGTISEKYPHQDP